MRISDWSSDVCSSDLHAGAAGQGEQGDHGRGGSDDRIHAALSPLHKNCGDDGAASDLGPTADAHDQRAPWAEAASCFFSFQHSSDRKSVVSGKMVSERVALGGRLFFTKKNT